MGRELVQQFAVGDVPEIRLAEDAGLAGRRGQQLAVAGKLQIGHRPADSRERADHRLIVEPDEPAKARFKSFEKLLRPRDELYDVAIIIDHNGLGSADSKVIPGRGSCVFMHIWRKKGRGTDGCTAMARWDLEKILEWLDPARKPVLVQLTKAELVKRKIPWALP